MRKDAYIRSKIAQWPKYAKITHSLYLKVHWHEKSTLSLVVEGVTNFSYAFIGTLINYPYFKLNVLKRKEN